MSLWRLFTSRWRGPADPQTNLQGKTVIVTGPSIGGLGFEAAAKISALGASRVILGARSEASGQAAKKAIEGRTGLVGRVEVWSLDMNSYDSIQSFAKRANALEHLDAAILNAGVFMADYKRSTYGWEETIQINVLSTALLALCLLCKLRDSGSGPLLEFVSSNRHSVIQIDGAPGLSSDNPLQAYNSADGYNANIQYRTSKLFMMHVMQTIASLMQSRNVALARPQVLITSVCPGPCRSQLSRGYDSFWVNLLRKFVFLFLRTQEQGARTLVSGLLLGPEGHGRLWKDDKIQKPAPILVGEEGERLRRKVWEEVITALEKDIPHTRDLVAACEA